MKLRTLIKSLPLSLALGCGGMADEGESLVHEKEGAVEQAVLAGWEVVDKRLSSQHPLPDRHKRTFTVEAAEGVRKFRMRFSKVDMERGYDYLIIKDGSGNEVQRFTGRHTNLLTNTIEGNRASIEIETDEAVRSWGFSLDQLRTRSCRSEDPSDLRMKSFRSCDTLEREIQNLAVKEVRRRFSQGHWGGPIPLRNLAANAERSAAPAHSETNVQVRGVDEADIVKTDGNRIYAIAGKQLRIYQSWPAADAELLHSVDIEGYPRELFLDAGRLIVLSGVQSDHFIGPPGPLVRTAFPIWWRSDAYTKITVLELGSGRPVIKSETLLAGQYNTARRIQDSVRVMLQRELQWPTIEYWPTGNLEWNSPEWEAEMDRLEAEAIQKVRSRSLEEWLPKSYRIENGRRVELSESCSDVLAPSGSDELGLTAVATVNIGQRSPSVQTTSLFIRSSQVYQSLENLYLTSDHQWSCYEDYGNKGQFTYLHKLDVSSPSRTSYRASGGVAGGIQDQFSLDEKDGNLRVAATNNRWNAPRQEDRSASFVYVLGQSGNDLEVIGQTPAMAPGEQIFGARFLGDRGFVVTFRQVDPLFTIDLTNPRNPRVVGELKVPGFSTYLHPLDENHLFTIGQDFEEDGRTRNGVALSIFDVRDLSRPRLAHKALIGTPSGYSEALYDHKAFTIYQEPGASDFVLAIPFTDYGSPEIRAFWQSFKSTLKVFRVSSLGILGLGELDHADLYERNDKKEFGWWYMPNIRRGVFVDRFVYAVSDSGLKVAAIANLAQVVKSVFAPVVWTSPTPAEELINENVRSEPNLAIPDGSPAGISASVEVERRLTIKQAELSLNLRHTYRGDLVVTLEHNGTVETLHNGTGGSRDDLVQTFTLDLFKGLDAKGTWTVKVVDTAREDVGRLVDFNLSLTGEAIE